MKLLKAFGRSRALVRLGAVLFWGDSVARDFAVRFYNSTAWLRCREAYTRSVFGLCERCGAPGEEVHHKMYLTPENINDPDITLSFENLELLCSSCHSREHMTKHSATRDDVMFNEDGDLIPVGAPPPLNIRESL